MKHGFVVALVFIASCSGQQSGSVTCGAPLTRDAICDVPGWVDRPYDVRLPDDFDASKTYPLILLMHGGGGQGTGALNQTCPDANKNSPKCLDQMAGQRGYIVIAPNGTSNNKVLKSIRGWNAGGGGPTYRCASGTACKENVDDMAYFDDLMKDISSRLPVDPKRVYLTGISNGGAISYRLACERADKIAGIAPVGGGNQFETTKTCSPSRPVPTLHIHGTDDPCWAMDGIPKCLGGNQKGKIHATIPDTLANLKKRHGCSGDPKKTPMPNPKNDGTESVRHTYQQCAVPTEFIEIKGGGHTWPDGHQYFAEKRIGRVPRDFGNEVILDFFDSLQ